MEEFYDIVGRVGVQSIGVVVAWGSFSLLKLIVNRLFDLISLDMKKQTESINTAKTAMTELKEQHITVISLSKKVLDYLSTLSKRLSERIDGLQDTKDKISNQISELIAKKDGGVK